MTLPTKPLESQWWERDPTHYELYRGYTIAIVGRDDLGPIVVIYVREQLGDGQIVGSGDSLRWAKATIDGWGRG